MRTVLILAASLSFLQAGCIAVSTAQISAGDLAGAIPLFHSLDPATVLGYTPLPGMQRMFTSRQLTLILEKYGVGDPSSSAVPDLCVERWAVPILSSKMKEALVAALDIVDADIDLVDFSRQPLPPGRLEFRRENLMRPPVPNACVIWRGRLLYDDRRSAAIWASLRISAERQRVIATENIRSGAAIRADEVRVITERQFPDWGATFSSAEKTIGKLARRSIQPGDRLVPGMLEDPPEVAKGENVHVQVTAGLARLSLDAVAQSAGKKGDTILLHNPLSGRNFRALVTDRGEAVAQPPGA